MRWPFLLPGLCLGCCSDRGEQANPEALSLVRAAQELSAPTWSAYAQCDTSNPFNFSYAELAGGLIWSNAASPLDEVPDIPTCLLIERITPPTGTVGAIVAIEDKGFSLNVGEIEVTFDDLVSGTALVAPNTGTYGFNADDDVISVEVTVPAGTDIASSWAVFVEQGPPENRQRSNAVEFTVNDQILIAADRNGDLYQVDADTGADSFLLDTFVAGPASAGTISSLIWNPAVNQIWAGAGGQGTCDSCLQRVNTGTGEVILVDLGDSTSGLGGMAILDATDSSEISSMSLSYVGFPVTPGRINALTTNSTNGVIYAVVDGDQATSYIGTLEPATGVVTYLATTLWCLRPYPLFPAPPFRSLSGQQTILEKRGSLKSL